MPKLSCEPAGWRHLDESVWKLGIQVTQFACAECMRVSGMSGGGESFEGSSRSLVTAPQNICTCSRQVLRLNLAFNQIEALSAGIKELQLLRELDLTYVGHKPITMCPPTARKAAFLKYSCSPPTDRNPPIPPPQRFLLVATLHNSHHASYSMHRNNCLENLPAEIGRLRCLRSLRVGNNRLTCIPEEVGRCTMLEELVANDNVISRVTLPWTCPRRFTSHQSFHVIVGHGREFLHNDLLLAPVFIVFEGTLVLNSAIDRSSQPRSLLHSVSCVTSLLSFLVQSSNASACSASF